MSLLDTIRADFEHVLGDHTTEIENALEIAAKVAGSPIAQLALGLTHIPPSTAERVAAFVQQLDADFGKLNPPAATATPAEPAPADPIAAPVESSASSPAAGGLAGASAAAADVTADTEPAADPTEPASGASGEAGPAIAAELTEPAETAPRGNGTGQP